MTIYFEKETEEPLNLPCEKIAEDVIRTALEMHSCPYETCVSIYMVNENTIQETNCENRGMDKVTDVLSFPNITFDKEGDFSVINKDRNYYEYFDPETDELILGDMMICQKRMLEQAKEYGHSILREFAFLVTHSILHLLGYDHMEEAEKQQMEETQRKILNKLSITRD